MGFKRSYIYAINKKLNMNRTVANKILTNLTGRSLARLINSQGILVTWMEGNKEISISPDLVIKVEIGLFQLITTKDEKPVFKTNSSLEMVYYLKKALTTKAIA